MARPRSAAFEDHRRSILDKGAALFANQGFLGTSMNQVAEACGITKATLYHYFRDKEDLLLSIADAHLCVLVELVESVEQESDAGEPKLRTLLVRILNIYAGARDAHRVLTEDVKYLNPDDLARLLGKERRVLSAFAEAVESLRPDLRDTGMAKPVAMLIFGMINWLFTWWSPEGKLRTQELSVLIDQFAFGGVNAVDQRTNSVAPQPKSQRSRSGGTPEPREPSAVRSTPPRPSARVPPRRR